MIKTPALGAPGTGCRIRIYGLGPVHPRSCGPKLGTRKVRFDNPPKGRVFVRGG